MSEITSFFGPRFVGQRFQQHTLPLEVLKDIAALEELVVELAKWMYIEEHQGRKRTPKQFTDGISLAISSIEPGSTIPQIVIQTATAGILTLFPPENQQYFTKAKDQIILAIEAAEKAEPISGIPIHLLGYFDKLGRSLREGEAIQFNPNATGSKAELNRESRRRLVLASQVQEIREEVRLRGIVSAMDKAKLTFDLDVIDGQKIIGRYELQHEPILAEAFGSFRETDPLRILVAGTAVYSRNNAHKIQRLDSIDHVSILDPLDVVVRLAELRQLNDGWLNGKGKAPSYIGTMWFENVFELHFPEDLPLPLLFPTGEGGLLAEWSFKPNEVSLELDIENYAGFYHHINLETDQEVEANFDLSNDHGWVQLIEKLRALQSNPS